VMERERMVMDQTEGLGKRTQVDEHWSGRSNIKREVER
jgi:hypothetical protein